MGLIGKIFIQGFEALLVRLHVESCKECRKKYDEILKHTLEELKEKDGKEKQK